LAEIESPDYPGERLIVCRNPALAEERRRKRNALLDLTERDLLAIRDRVTRERRPLRGAAAIGRAVGAALARRKVGKDFEVTITDDGLRVHRDEPAIAAEAALDGLYVLRTSLPPDGIDAADTVRADKGLARAERAFRSLKTVDLEVRPVFHSPEPRVRAHVFLCMLAYYVEWHMRQALAPMLFDDHDRAAAEARRASPVAKAEPSPAARRKAQNQDDRRRHAGAQPALAPRRPRHPHPQHRPLWRRDDHGDPRHADAAPAPRLRAARHQARHAASARQKRRAITTTSLNVG
jgi:hypothetical protein